MLQVHPIAIKRQFQILWGFWNCHQTVIPDPVGVLELAVEDSAKTLSKVFVQKF
jgi:hypothetical protein